MRRTSRLMSRLRRLVPASLLRRGRNPGLRTAKTTLAAVAAYVVADWLNTSPQPVLAALTALLVVQLTMYETIAHGLQRVGSVLAGVLVAIGVATFVGLTWWSLGAVVAVSLVVGRLLRLGPHLLEVPISAMLVLAVGGADDVATGRVYETFVGAAVGIVVNAVIAAPLYVQPASDAIGELADRMAQLLRGLAGQLRADWSRAAADHWLNEARALGTEVARADRNLTRAEQSARLNPRGASAREAQPRLDIALTGLEHCYAALRNLCRALLDRTYFVPANEEATAYGADVRTTIADLFDRTADAMGSVVTIAAGIGSVDEARGEVEAHLAELSRGLDRLRALLVVDPQVDEGAWQQHGALLAAIDHLHIEMEAAVRPPQEAWRPPPVGERQRQAVRRIVDAAAHAVTEFHPPGLRAEPDEPTDRRPP